VSLNDFLTLFFGRNKVKDYILEAFAGPADKGVYVSSTENTLYLTA
jgi:hypothetical protein